MNHTQFTIHIEKLTEAIQNAITHDLPEILGNKAASMFRQNFQNEGFFGKKWGEVRRRHPEFKFPGADGSRKILSGRTGNLGRSIRYKVGKGQAVVYSDAVYAKIHNEGGEIPVTAKMKKYFWAMYYQTKGKTVGRTKKQRDILTKQAKLYRAMALKKIGSAIKIPKRHFLGKSPKPEAELKKLITKHLSGIIKH